MQGEAGKHRIQKTRWSYEIRGEVGAILFSRPSIAESDHGRNGRVVAPDRRGRSLSGGVAGVFQCDPHMADRRLGARHSLAGAVGVSALWIHVDCDAFERCGS
jgi:hypothetical protein